MSVVWVVCCCVFCVMYCGLCVVDARGLPLTSPPPANVVSARPKPNRLVRTKASTSVMKQVGTYLHMYCKRLSQLREHLWSVPADRE